MLSHFSVKNYKCLADVSLPLTPLHVLIGQNDTGKTSLMEAIFDGVNSLSRLEAGDDYGNDRLEVESGIGDELVWKKAAEKRVRLELVLSARGNQKTGAKTWQTDIWFDHRGAYQGVARLDDVALFDRYGKPVSGGADYLDSMPDYIEVTAKRYKFEPRTMSRPSAILEHARLSLDHDGFGLATLLDEVKDYDVDRFTALQSTFREYFKQYKKIRLETSPAWARNTTEAKKGTPYTPATGKRVLLATDDGDIRLEQASDGAILLLGFLALMYSPKPPDVLLIEEPENGIHPKRLIEVAKLLRQFVEREENAPQIIFTTHSPYLLSEFQPEEVTLMRRQPDGSAKAFPLRDAKHIKERMGSEFYLGELWYNLDEEELLK
jgi:predicted ATPase